MFFEYAKRLTKRGSVPFNIFVEEAHRYIKTGEDIDLIGYNIFDRISKEGRKYGVMLNLISQRPVELSETVMSQCANYLIFKTTHPRDIEYITQMVPYITDEIIEKQKGLQPGYCLAFGSAFKVPIIIHVDLPNPVPNSDNVCITKEWSIER
jgi:DNA helicase HerA-like ATPase